MTHPFPPSYPGGDVPTARPARPPTVSVAFWLQLGLVAALVLAVVTAIADAIHFDGLIDRAAARVSGADPTEIADERAMNLQAPFMVGVPGLVLALWYAASAVPLWRGSDVGRILSLVGTGLWILCCGSSVALGGFFGVLFIAGAGPELMEGPPDASSGEQDYGWPESAFLDELYRLDGTGWSVVYDAVGMVSVAAAFLLCAAVAVLLLVPPSNRYFRGQRQPAIPMPVGGYAPYPGGPVAPYPMTGYPAVHPGYPYPFPQWPSYPSPDHRSSGGPSPDVSGSSPS